MKRKILSIIAVFVLFFAVVLFTTACTPKAEGDGVITVEVIDIEGQVVYQKDYNFKKDDTLIGILKADIDLKLVTDDQGYGAFITSVYGISQESGLTSGKFWIIYINDESAEVGISSIPLVDEDVIKLVIEAMSW